MYVNICLLKKELFVSLLFYLFSDPLSSVYNSMNGIPLWLVVGRSSYIFKLNESPPKSLMINFLEWIV